MFSPLFLLALLAAVVGFRVLHRAAGSGPRRVFLEREIPPDLLGEGLLHALVADRGHLRRDTRIEQVDRGTVTLLRSGGCGRLVLFAAADPNPEADLHSLQRLAAKLRLEGPLALVVVGGSREFGREAARLAAPLRVFHVDTEGRLRESRGRFRPAAPRQILDRALDRMAADLGEGAFPAIDFEMARDLLEGAPDHLPQETNPFRGVVTSALSLAIVACFLVEVAITWDALGGEGATLSVVYRMGAIEQRAILAGELFRLVAAPFLHFGLLHLGMNGWAQWTLGTPIEFLLGPWRFFALWLGSALGASVTSVLFNETSVAAGASGAIFGLLGAFTTFVFFRKDVLPQPVPRSLRNGVLATLVLNLMISFIPGIDMAAHAGGFLTGALLALGLARPGGQGARTGRSVQALRGAVLLLMILGVGVSSVRNRADLTVTAPALGSEFRIGDLVLPIPAAYEVTVSRGGEVTTVEADPGPATPFLVTYKVSEPQPDRESARKVLERLRPDPVPVKDSDWIALSQLGVQNLRAVEIIVVAPASCRDAAESLVADLVRHIR